MIIFFFFNKNILKDCMAERIEELSLNDELKSLPPSSSSSSASSSSSTPTNILYPGFKDSLKHKSVPSREPFEADVLHLRHAQTNLLWFGCRCGEAHFKAKPSHRWDKVKQHIESYQKQGRPHGPPEIALAHWGKVNSVENIQTFIGVRGTDTFFCRGCSTYSRTYKGLKRTLRHAQGCLQGDVEESLSAAVQQLKVQYKDTTFLVDLTAGDETTGAQLLAEVRSQWGAEHVDLARITLAWDPPTHISKERLSFTDSAVQSRTVAQLGLWNLDVLHASISSTASGQEIDSKERAQFKRFHAAYLSELETGPSRTPLMQGLFSLLAEHAPWGLTVHPPPGTALQLQPGKKRPALALMPAMVPSTPKKAKKRAAPVFVRPLAIPPGAAAVSPCFGSIDRRLLDDLPQETQKE